MSLAPFEVLKPQLNTKGSVISQGGAFDGEQEPDSGYASATFNTPESSERIFKCPTVNGAEAVKHALALASVNGAGDLIAFNKEINRATADRFRDILDRLEAPLFAYMQKSWRKHQPMALRLMILGRTEAEAKPYIVALCHEDRVKRVQRFFRKPYVKETCRPQDSTIPSFEVTVIGQAPCTRSGGAIDVHMDMFSSTAGARRTCCGTLVKLSKDDKYRLGTMGGLIKVTSISGKYTLYGMVAGHLIEGMEPAGADYVDGANPSRLENMFDSSEEDSDWDSAEEESEEESHPVSDTPIPCGLRTHRAPLKQNSALLEAFPGSNKSGSEKHEWQPIGHVINRASRAAWPLHSPPVQRARDWSLVSFSSEFGLEPNMLNDKNIVSKAADLKLPSKSMTTSSAALPVLLSSGAQGLLPGTLSPLPCSYWSGVGNKFVRAFSFTLRDGALFGDGDSGAWVIDDVAFEVHGHFVASDVFGDGYVIPILDTLREIKQQFNAHSVEFPSALDVKFMPRPGQQSANHPNQQSSEYHTRESNPWSFTPLPARQVTPKPDNERRFSDSGYVSMQWTPTQTIEDSMIRPYPPETRFPAGVSRFIQSAHTVPYTDRVLDLDHHMEVMGGGMPYDTFGSMVFQTWEEISRHSADDGSQMRDNVATSGSKRGCDGMESASIPASFSTASAETKRRRTEFKGNE